MPRRRQGQYPRPFDVTLGPWVGVDDRLGGVEVNPAIALLAAENMQVWPDGALATAPQLSAGLRSAAVVTTGEVRGVTADATSGYYFAVQRDALWRFPFDSSATVVNVAPSALATWLGTGSTPVTMLAFAGQIILARDGQIPQRLTNLTANPVTMTAISLNVAGTETTTGAPTVYSGRVFFPITSDRSTFVWSEPGDPSLGYQQTGYVNFWRFAQTSTAPLVGLWGTNSRLLVAREGGSMAGVYGQASADFATTATSDDIATGIGTPIMSSFVQAGDVTAFVDGAGFVRMVGPSGPASDPVAGMGTLRSVFEAVDQHFGALYFPETSTVCLRYRVTIGLYQATFASNLRTGEYATGGWGFVSVHLPTRRYTGTYTPLGGVVDAQRCGAFVGPRGGVLVTTGAANTDLRVLAPDIGQSATTGGGNRSVIVTHAVSAPVGATVVPDVVRLTGRATRIVQSAVDNLLAVVAIRGDTGGTLWTASTQTLVGMVPGQRDFVWGVEVLPRVRALHWRVTSAGDGWRGVQSAAVAGWIDAPEPDVV